MGIATVPKMKGLKKARVPRPPRRYPTLKNPKWAKKQRGAPSLDQIFKQ